MQEAYSRLQGLKAQESSSVEVPDFLSRCREALDDDLNTPIAIAHLFEAAKVINSAHDGIITLSAEDIEKLKTLFDEILIQVLGVRVGTQASGTDLTPYEGAVDLLMEIRANAKKNKDWATSDLIRDKLAALGFSVKDTKNGVEWSV
jgi:cysteinyl-tRNA synthetase